MGLIETINSINKRVGALESNNLDENAPVAEIQKIYSNVRITATVTASVHQYNICGESTICSEDLKV